MGALVSLAGSLGGQVFSLTPTALVARGISAIAGIGAAAVSSATNAANAANWMKPSLVSLSVPLPIPSTATTAAGIANFSAMVQLYVFDAVMKLEHTRELRKTEHPVQTGANISDHAYLMPARIVLEIGMSDAMMSYQPTNWTGSLSKSVSAYRTLVTLQRSRALMTLTTRLQTYNNMLIESIQATEDQRTVHGLKATITFSEIFLATVTAVNSTLKTDTGDSPVSSVPQQTDSGLTGQVQAPAASPALANSFGVSYTNQQLLLAPLANVPPGAGGYTSNQSQIANLGS